MSIVPACSDVAAVCAHCNKKALFVGTAMLVGVEIVALLHCGKSKPYEQEDG